MDLQTLFYIVGIVFMLLSILVMVFCVVFIVALVQGIRHAKESVTAKVISLAANSSSVFTTGLLVKNILIPLVKKIFRKNR
ncbi:hypothetical protein HGA88_02355 [Candidatus Roizmanbacteria bacterium]|nr:hypothetical protein [Candidatus Roizmanbacteria bacterium]